MTLRSIHVCPSPDLPRDGGRTARPWSRLLTAAAAALSLSAAGTAPAEQAAPPATAAVPTPAPTPSGGSFDKLPAALAVGRIAYEDNGVIKVIDLAADTTQSFDLPERMEEPSWNPDGKRFAYASGFGVSILDIPGQMFLSVSAPGRPAAGPSWSGDGQRLIYAVRGEQPGLELYDTRGKARTRVALPPQATQPAWHPREERLAFVAPVDGVDQVFVVGAACLKDGSCDKPAAALVPVQVTKGGKASRRPAWSPDGTRLAFERDAGDGHGTGIFVMSGEGHDLRRLSPIGSDDHAPSWGSNNALALQRGGDKASICVMETDGARTFTVIKDGGRSPSWWQPRP